MKRIFLTWVVLGATLGFIALKAAQPVIPRQETFQTPSGGSGFSNLRVIQQSADGTEVTMSMDYSYNGSGGASAQVVPVIEKRGEKSIAYWFGVDPVGISVGHGVISMKVKYFNDEPGVPNQYTSDRIRMLILNQSGNSIIGSSMFLKNITWGDKTKPEIPVPSSNKVDEQRKAEAEQKRLAEEKRKAEEKALAEAKAKEEEQRKAEAVRVAEEKRLAREKELAEAKLKLEQQQKMEAEQKRLADEKRKAEEKALAEARAKEEEQRKVEAARIAEEKRLAREKELAEAQLKLEQKRLADEKRKAEEKALAEAKAKAEEERKAEAARIAEEKRLAREKELAEAKLKSEQKRKQESDQKRLAEEKRKSDAKSLAEAKAKAEEERKAEASRIAEEKRLAREKELAEAKSKLEQQQKLEAEQKRLAEEKRKAEEKALAEAKAKEEQRKAAEARLAEEKRLAREKELAEAKLKLEQQQKLEAEQKRLAEEKRKAEEKALADAKAKEEQLKAAEARLAEEKRLAREKELAEAKLKLEQQQKLEAEQKRIADQKKSQPAVPPNVADTQFADGSQLKTKITNVDVVNRSLDRSKVTFSVEFEYRDSFSKPVLGVQPSNSEDPKSIAMFDSNPMEIGKSRRNWVLLPIKFQPQSEKTTSPNSLSTDKLWVYLSEATSPQKFNIFTATMLLMWNMPGTKSPSVSVIAASNAVQIDEIKQNSNQSGQVTVRYSLASGQGKLRLKVSDSRKPELSGFIVTEDIRIQSGNGVQILEFRVKQDAPNLPTSIKVDNFEVQLLDTNNQVLMQGTKKATVTLKKS